MRVIALEEHFLTESIAHASSPHRERPASRMMDEMELLLWGHPFMSR